MLRKLIGWLNRRFPERLELTLAEYKQMREELAQYNLVIQGIGQLNDRLVSLEAQVKRLNDQNGYINTSKGSLRLER